MLNSSKCFGKNCLRIYNGGESGDGFLIFSVVGRIERWRAHHAVYHSSKCEGAVSEWRDQRASRLPCPTSMTSCRIAMFAHRVANNFTSWNRWLKLQRFGWKPSHVDFNKAALHALKLAHYGVRRHLCRKQIRNHVEKQSQLEPRWKIVQRSLLAEFSAVDSWFISSPPMKAIKKPMMKHAMKVLFWKFEIHI